MAGTSVRRYVMSYLAEGERLYEESDVVSGATGDAAHRLRTGFGAAREEEESPVAPNPTGEICDTFKIVEGTSSSIAGFPSASEGSPGIAREMPLEIRPQIAQRMAVARVDRNDAGVLSFPVSREGQDMACFSSHTSLSGGGTWGRESAGDG